MLAHALAMNQDYYMVSGGPFGMDQGPYLDGPWSISIMYLDYLEWTWYILYMLFFLFLLFSCVAAKKKAVKYSPFCAIHDGFIYTDDGIKCMQKVNM